MNQSAHKEFNLESISTALQHYEKYYKAFIIIVGLVGNFMTIVIFARSRIAHSNRTSFYLISLAISDICFLISLFVSLLDDFNAISPNSYVCKSMVYTQFVFTFVSCVIVLTFTAQRLCVIRFPLRSNLLNQKRSRNIFISLFIFGLFFYSPNLVFYDMIENPMGKFECSCPKHLSRLAEILTNIDTIFTFIIPFFGMLIMNTMMVRTLKKSSYNFILRTSSNRHFSCEPNKNNNNKNNRHHNQNHRIADHRSNDSLHLSRIPAGISAGLGIAAPNSQPSPSQLPANEQNLLFNSENNLHNQNRKNASFKQRRSRLLSIKKKSTSLSSSAKSSTGTQNCCFHFMRFNDEDFDDDYDFECSEYTNNNNNYKKNKNEDHFPSHHTFHYSDRVIEEDENQAEMETYNENLKKNTSSSNKNSSSAHSGVDGGGTVATEEINNNNVFAFNKHKDSIVKYSNNNNHIKFSKKYQEKIDGDESKSIKNEIKYKLKCFKCIKFTRPASYDSILFTTSMNSANTINNSSFKKQRNNNNEFKEPNEETNATASTDSRSPQTAQSFREAFRAKRSISLYNRSSVMSLNNRTNITNTSQCKTVPVSRRFYSFKVPNGSHKTNAKRARDSMKANGFSRSSIQKMRTKSAIRLNSSIGDNASISGIGSIMRISSARPNSVSKRVTKMLIIVSSVFLILNLPIHTINIYSSLSSINPPQDSNSTNSTIFIDSESTETGTIVVIANRISIFLFYTSFSCNFLLYSISGAMFRTEIKRLFMKLIKIRPRNHV